MDLICSCILMPYMDLHPSNACFYAQRHRKLNGKQIISAFQFRTQQYAVSEAFSLFSSSFVIVGNSTVNKESHPSKVEAFISERPSGI